MVGAGIVRLRHHRAHRRAELEIGFTRYFYSIATARSPGLANVSGHPWHHHQPLSIFLASVTGSRGRKSRWSPHARAPAGRNASRSSGTRNRRRRRHIFFQLGHVLHYLDHGADLASSRADHIETSKDAAEALRPLAGNFAAALFTFGVLGVGFLAIPTLTGSSAYAFAETFGWHQGLDAKFKSARAFYAVVVFSTLAGIGLNWARVNPVRALFWTAVINGLLAPFLLVAVLLIATDRKIMKGQPSSPIAIIFVGVTTLLMFGAAIGMFVF